MSQTIAFYPVETEQGWAIGKFREHEPGYELQPQWGYLARPSAEHRANELNAQLGLSDSDVRRIVESTYKAGKTP